MSDNPDPWAEGKATEAADGSYTEVKIAFDYGNVTATVRRPTTAEVEAELPNAIKVAVGAQRSLATAYNEAKGQKAPSTPGEYGKPAGANTDVSTDLPFADSIEKSGYSVNECKHGERSLFEHSGKKGWVCSKPKGDADRCETVFV